LNYEGSAQIRGREYRKYALDSTEDKKLGRTDFPSYLIVETGKQYMAKFR